MKIINPIIAIKSSKEIHSRIHQAPRDAHPRRRRNPTNLRLEPRQIRSIQIEQIIQLSVPVRLPSEYKQLLVIDNSRMLQPARRRLPFALHRPYPLLNVQVEYNQIIEPGLSVAPTEDVHLMINYTRRMELPSRRILILQTILLLLQPPALHIINRRLDLQKHHIIQDFISIPASMDHNLGLVELSSMTHPRIRLLPRNLRLNPDFLLGVQDKNIIQDFLAAVSLSPAEYNHVFAEIGGRVTVPRRRRAGIHL